MVPAREASLVDKLTRTTGDFDEIAVTRKNVKKVRKLAKRLQALPSIQQSDLSHLYNTAFDRIDEAGDDYQAISKALRGIYDLHEFWYQ